jgi:hypothetical protein
MGSPTCRSAFAMTEASVIVATTHSFAPHGQHIASIAYVRRSSVSPAGP